MDEPISPSDEAAAPNATLESPEVGILRALQNNQLSDVALQSIGMIILGTAITSQPELMDHEQWVNYEVTVQDNDNWERFELCSEHVCAVPISDLPGKLGEVVKCVQSTLLDIVRSRPNRILAGSLRLHAAVYVKDKRSPTSTYYQPNPLTEHLRTITPPCIELCLLWVGSKEEMKTDDHPRST